MHENDQEQNTDIEKSSWELPTVRIDDQKE